MRSRLRSVRVLRALTVYRSQLLTKFRSAFAHRSLTVRSAFAHRLLTVRSAFAHRSFRVRPTFNYRSCGKIERFRDCSSIH